MGFISEPRIDVKIRKMAERVRWRDPAIADRGIDQTRLVFDDGKPDTPEFSFMVIGDSGSGPHRGHNPQRQIAEQMFQHRDECRFVLHTGDVIYLVGSSEYYPKNFIEPYREFLVGGETGKAIAYDQMVFAFPILPVPGNHDYYDLSPFYGLAAQLMLPVRRLLQSHVDLDVGWHGSYQGRAYARAFLDCLKDRLPGTLDQHLNEHYTAKTKSGACLRYQPGHFTRLPNRYYSFRMGGIDFFALDSNTFNAPSPLPDSQEGDAYRRILEKRLEQIERDKMEVSEASAKLTPDSPDTVEQMDDLQAKLQQLDEVERDILKQLASNEMTVVDSEQLNWLEKELIESWHDPDARGRIIYFHHPPYVTEATKWHQAQTLMVRRRLRRVLNDVAKAIGSLSEGRSIVDLVLNGHAHCLEHLQTVDTGHADAYTNWIICGGSGYSLRRQRQEGPELTELMEAGDDAKETFIERSVAKSKLYVGRKGSGSQKHRPYSFLRIDVKAGNPPRFVVRPFISDWFEHRWVNQVLDPFEVCALQSSLR
ncbi:metallophosphoesterase [Oscillatoria sp. FACHB-1407]|uniref:metallophosphoesterase family protein n=1 Tax=Oscillatoria sp. FACHB-1407 TaxID=2692847 RepID=UPI001683914B|nr:metallophosphoesterase [Oscillatoria sp. FACHB-1407]MBD2463242.1 metallophosphoesterase [Oscillatoria sp. FACHB-1407]